MLVFIGPEGYGVVSRALTMPTNLMRVAGPVLASLAWAAFGGYTLVLRGLAGIMLVAAAGFAAAAFLSKRAEPLTAACQEHMLKTRVSHT